LNFTKSNCRDFIANVSGFQFTRLQSTGSPGLREMLEFYYKLQPKAKQFSSLQKRITADLVCLGGESHWQCCERLPQVTAGMCVAANGENFEHVMWQFK